MLSPHVHPYAKAEKRERSKENDETYCTNWKDNFKKQFCTYGDDNSADKSYCMSIYDEPSHEVETFGNLENSVCYEKTRLLFLDKINDIIQDGHRVNFMRKNENEWKFYFPEKKKIARKEDIKLKLPTSELSTVWFLWPDSK